MRGEKRIRLIRIFVIPSIIAAGLLIALVPFLVEQSARSQILWVYSTTKIHIDGNLALAAYCNDPQMDGLSWETAYIIKDQAIDANGIGSPIDISNTTRFLIIQNVSCKNAEPTASAGIRLYNCSYVKIFYCDLLDNGVLDPYGLNTTSNIWLYECHNCTIEENFFSGDGYAGISISDSSKNNITSNLLYQNSTKDIYLTGSSQNLIKNNIFKDISMTGPGSINLENSPNNTILGNEMVSRRSYTLYFSTNSHSNNISGNIMRRNGGGTGAVIRIEQANNNLIVGNSISEASDPNAKSVDQGSGNQWDNGTNGNYWSNYAKHYPSAGNNGIVWNTPFELEGGVGAKDNFPLVQQPAIAVQIPQWLLDKLPVDLGTLFLEPAVLFSLILFISEIILEIGLFFYVKQSRLREYVQRPQAELIRLLRMGKFDDARKYLEDLRLIIRKAGRVKFLTVAGERLKWIQTLEAIRKYFGDVDRKSLEEVSQHLTMNIIDLVELLASANEIFPGFKIEGRDLVLEASCEVGHSLTS